MFDLPILVAVAAIIVTAAALFIDALQTRTIRKLGRRFDMEAKAFEERGTIGEQFGEWLLDQKGPDKPTNMQILTGQVGHQIANSFSMASKGMRSGDERLERSVERKMLEGLQTPESTALLAACDRFGIPRELASVLLGAAERNGLLPQILKNDGQTHAGGLQY